MSVDVTAVLDDGPWTHRFVSANGARFHVAEAKTADGAGSQPDRPLVLLLHGFPQFWWTWRHQMDALSHAGYRVAAMDLRGYGASDKPPRGYDTPTLCADVAGVIRSLGVTDAVVVGHDWGAWIAWSMPSLQPRTTRAVAALSLAHPLRMQAWPVDLRQLWGNRHAWAFQVPIRPERQLTDGGVVSELLERWAAPGWPGPEEVRRYTEAMRVPFVAHSAMEYYRWAARSLPRPDGRRFAAAVRHTIAVPVLQLHGALDTCVLPAYARSSSRFVRGQYRWELVDGAGHFLPEEAPEATSALLVDWLDGLQAR